MFRSGKLAAVLGATVVLAACGGSDGVRADELVEPRWTLTILSPAHGGLVLPETVVEVGISGDGEALDEERGFDFGVFVDGELVTQSAEPEIVVDLEPGDRIIAVEGVDANGEILEEVLGDEVQVRVGDAFQPDLDRLGVPPRLPTDDFDRSELPIDPDALQPNGGDEGEVLEPQAE